MKKSKEIFLKEMYCGLSIKHFINFYMLAVLWCFIVDIIGPNQSVIETLPGVCLLVGQRFIATLA